MRFFFIEESVVFSVRYKVIPELVHAIEEINIFVSGQKYKGYGMLIFTEQSPRQSSCRHNISHA